MIMAFWYALRRDVQLAVRQGGGWMNPLVFFVMVVTLVPLAISPLPEQLALMATGIIWIAALLAVLLAMDGLFRSDYDDGSLEQLMLSATPLPVLALAKVIAHWLLTGFCLTLIAPVAAVLLNVQLALIPVLCTTLLLGTLTMSLLSAIGAALTVSLKRGGVLVPLITLPLHIPIVIFATATVKAAEMNQAISGFLALQAALLLLALMLAPLATAAALRLHLAIDTEDAM